MQTSELITEARTKAIGMEYSQRWLVLEMARRLEMATNITTDVVEVRHGEWVKTQEPMGWKDVDCIECSSCHESWVMDNDLCLDDYKDGWKYCPNCGAKMDGKGENDV